MNDTSADAALAAAQAAPAAAQKAGRKEWIGLAVIALPCLLYSMDLTVLNLALPTLSAELAPSPSQLLWIVDIYGFMVAGLLMTMGSLGDRIGRRRLLLIGAAAFGVASVAAAFANSASMLIAMRAVLGIAGATLAPSTLSLIRNMFHDPHQRTIAIGVWITSYSVGAAIGPVVGGVLLEYFWWGSVFLLAVPVMVLLLIVGPLLLPEYRDPNPGRPDIASAVLSLIAVLAMIYGFKRMAEQGFSATALATVFAGLVVGWLFVRRQQRLADPMIDLRLLRIPAFGTAVAVSGVTSVIAFGIFIFIAQYMQLVLDLSPLAAGLATVPFALAFVVGSMLTPLLVKRIAPARLMAAGFCVAAVGFAMIAWLQADSPLWFLVTAFVVYSLGLAPVFTLATDFIVGNAPPERAGAASAISETCSEFGGALGIAVLGSVGLLMYRSGMSDAGFATTDTLAHALELARKLGDPRQAAAAKDAFVAGMQLVAWIAVVVSLLAGLCTAITLGRDQKKT